MAKRHIPMTMEDWAKRIDLILEVGGDNVLDNAGHITAEFAKHFAEAEFEKYRIIQDKNFSSDFDKLTGNTFYCLKFRVTFRREIENKPSFHLLLFCIPRGLHYLCMM